MRVRVRARAHLSKISRAHLYKILACACVRVRMFQNFRVRVRAHVRVFFGTMSENEQRFSNFDLRE